MPSGRCPAHTKAKAAIAPPRLSPSKRGYDGAWERLRKIKLAADPMCQIQTHCGDRSITRQVATEVDHIIPIAERPDLRLDYDNLQSACKSCHSAKTARENRLGGASG